LYAERGVVEKRFSGLRGGEKKDRGCFIAALKVGVKATNLKKLGKKKIVINTLARLILSKL